MITENVATLIHDLKTPVIAQERVLDLLLKNTFGELTKTQSEIILQIKESCEYLENIVINAMKTYITDNTKLDLEKEVFDLKELINTIVEQFHVIANENSLKFEEKIYCNKFYADKFQIKRVIINLISNAIKYSQKNTKIKIYCYQTNRQLVFYVKNISNEIKNIKKVFDKFESTTNSGIGLYLVKKVVEYHNGNVFANVNKNNVCTFGFVLPL